MAGSSSSLLHQEVLRPLRDLNRQFGQTMVLVTHDEEVGQVCDRVIRMRDGEIVSVVAPLPGATQAPAALPR